MKSMIIGLSVLAAFAGAAVLSTPAYSKDKKSKAEEAADELKEKRAKLVEKFETKKKGKLFLNAPTAPYWVDLEKVGESRWSVETKKAGSETQTYEIGATFAAQTAGQPPFVQIQVWGYRHHTQKGSTRSIISFSFDDANMSGVKPSKLDDWILANYLTFYNKSKDPIDKECSGKKPKKASGYGPAKLRAYAVATDPELNTRVRKEWYGWVNKEWTYEVRVTYSNAVHDKDTYQDKVKDFIKNIKSAK